MGYVELSNQIYTIFKSYAQKNNEETLKPYYNICKLLHFRPLILHSPTVYFKTSQSNSNLIAIKNAARARY